MPRLPTPLLLLGLLLAGCPTGGGEGGADVEADSRVKRMPPALLPWKALPDSVAVLQPLAATDATTGKTSRVPQALMAVAGLPGRVAVVFLPGDEKGLWLASAGVDVPWSRVKLSDLEAAQIGALDAVGDGERIHVFLRERGSTALHHLSWRPDGAIERERLPSVEGDAAASWAEGCDDLRVALSNSGEFAVSKGLHTATGFAGGITTFRKRPGSAWRNERWADAPTTAPPNTIGAFWDNACRAALAFDGTDRLRVLTHLEPLFDRVRSGDGPREVIAGRRSFVSSEVANGLHGGDGSPDFERGTDGSYRVSFDLIASDQGRIWLSPGSTALASKRAALLDWNFDRSEVQPASPMGAPEGEYRFLGPLWTDDCGSAGFMARNLPLALRNGASTTFCFGARYPPVLERRAVGNVIDPTVVAVDTVRGPKTPFTGALCAHADGTLDLCGLVNRLPFTSDQKGVELPPESNAVVHFSASSPADGARDVPLDVVRSATCVGGRDDGMPCYVSPALLEAARNRPVMDDGSPAPLLPGRTYRLHLSDQARLSPAARVSGWLLDLEARPRPFATFRTAGDAGADPRDVPNALPCELVGSRDPDGICHQRAPVAQETTVVLFPLSRPPAEAGARPWAIRPDGSREDAVGMGPLGVELGSPVRQPGTWTLHLPDDLIDGWGTVPPTNDRVLRFDVEAPFTVTAFTPAEGASGVDRAVQPQVTFSEPTSVANLTLEGPFGPVTASVRQLSPTTWQLRPAATLAGSGLHTLKVVSAVALSGRALSSSSPLRSSFTTAP